MLITGKSVDVLKSFSNGDRGIEWMDRVRERECVQGRETVITMYLYCMTDGKTVTDTIICKSM